VAGPWVTIKERYARLVAACRDGGPLEEPWSDFVAGARKTEANPPEHLWLLIPELRGFAERRGGRENVTILDHGTGTAINILYLAALGYTDVWGANVVDKAQPQNRVFREMLGFAEDRIFVYDGTFLPLPDESVDIVLSQQVAEHVPDAALDGYYAEEGRVLRSGGMALHQVPHRWMPYDDHTKTWFVTYLPRRLRDMVWPRLATNPSQIGTYLFLRDRADHMGRARAFIGDTRDHSLTRIVGLKAGRDREGGGVSGALRRIFGRAMSVPLAGPVVRAAIRPISMLETVSVKR
jgi:SAM-dependent methyltransferase